MDVGNGGWDNDEGVNSFCIPLWLDLGLQTVHCSGLYGVIALSHDCSVFEFGSLLAYSKMCQLAGVPFYRQ